MPIAKHAGGDGDGDTLDVWKRLWALAHGLDNRSKRMAATIGVTGVERLIIRFISQQRRTTPSVIAKTLNISPGTLSRVLRRLEERRFVGRRKDPSDRRCMLLVLTARGMRVDRERHGTVEAAVRRTLGRLDPQTIEGSAELLVLLAGELRSE